MDEVAPQSSSSGSTKWELLPATQIDDLAKELNLNGNLLSALAGPTICLTVDTGRRACRCGMTGEDLTRMLVNLVKNAVEAMPAGGRSS